MLLELLMIMVDTGYGVSYKDIYTKETIQIIADWYKKGY